MVKFTLNLTPRELSQLDLLQDALNTNTRAGVLRRALDLLVPYAESKQKGHQVCVEEQDGTLRKLRIV